MHSIHRESITSKLLAGNPAGVDPVRPVNVYVPETGAENLPVVYILAPWTNAGRCLFDWKPFKESLPARLDRLIGGKKIPPAVFVCPDLYTDYGGSQYIDSEFFGPHGRFLVEELFPTIEEKYPVKRGGAHRAVMGRSSGGFGALRLAMDFPGSVGALACHSGDAGFDLMFVSDFATLPKSLCRFDNDVDAFVAAVREKPKVSGNDIHVLMLLGNGGFYSSSKNGIDLPINLHSGEIDQKVWSRWLEHDPVRRIDKAKDNLKGLKNLYLECGVKDQFNLLYGARQIHDKLDTYGIKHVYEEFDDNHSGTEYRFDVSLPIILNDL